MLLVELIVAVFDRSSFSFQVASCLIVAVEVRPSFFVWSELAGRLNDMWLMKVLL